MDFSALLIEWYWDHRRHLPWRETSDPYKIWLSEIILQQTRIEQGRDYYLRFVERFPTVADLAAASEEEVLKCWQGLGYYSRARNMHAAARHIEYGLGGRFPSSYEGILALKGVGRYTAAAIASFAFKLPYPVIDGNVYRLISRLYGIRTPIATSAAYSEFEALLKRLIDPDRPDVFNQAMMDFGSTYCKPTGCDCPGCIFADYCQAYRKGIVDILPVRKDKAKVKTRYFWYLDVEWEEDGALYRLVHQRDGKDIWKGLYEFPLWEFEEDVPFEAVEKKARELLGEADISNGRKLVHKLTHRTIEASFLVAKLAKRPARIPGKEQAVSREQLKKMPVSRLIDRYLEDV